MKYSFALFKKDVKFFLINMRYWRKYRFVRAKNRNALYFVFRPEQPHAGIADRLKAVIALYNHAKANGYGFKFYFETPFVLTDFLRPNTDWPLKLEELEYSVFDTKIINETNWHKLPKLIPNKQYHCYNYTGNEIPWQFEDTGYCWSHLFQELFAPSDILREAIESCHMEPHDYISVQLRFVNALERFENTFFDNYLETQEERDKLIRKCKKGIMEIVEEHKGIPVYVFSDSKIFLESLSDMPVKVLNSESIGHTNEQGKTDVYLKSFLDLFIMSKSKDIYRILSPELYQWSCYALLAARIGDIPFHDKWL